MQVLGSLLCAGQFTVAEVSVASANTFTPNPGLYSIADISILSYPLLVVTPSAGTVDGNAFVLRFSNPNNFQVTFDQGYAFGSDINPSDVPTTAGKGFEITIRFHATSEKWRIVGLSRGF